MQITAFKPQTIWFRVQLSAHYVACRSLWSDDSSLGDVTRLDLLYPESQLLFRLMTRISAGHAHMQNCVPGHFASPSVGGTHDAESLSFASEQFQHVSVQLPT